MRILFRVDAAHEIGAGHVMRCLCLAGALRMAGHHCSFVCRRRSGDLIEAIEARGFACAVLPSTNNAETAKTWLGADPDTEISQSQAAIVAELPDWLVVDHYALNAEWERAVAPEGVKVMVIDDLADRPHDCDLLLDQQLTNRSADYGPLLPDRARMLLGPAYALLRPEFAELRVAAEARDRSWPPARILVNLGGFDPENATQAVLETLSQSDLPSSCGIDVVMGRNAPHVDDVRAYSETSRLDARVAVDVTDMGARMLAADLAIGAAGTTSWERVCLGLPSLMLSISENQLGVAKALAAAGAAINLGPFWQQGWQNRLVDALDELSTPGGLARMSAVCRALVDGAGTARVVRTLDAPPLTLRPATPDDAERVWLWREADGAPRHYRMGKPTPWEAHKRWFDAALKDPRHSLFIVEEKGHPVAHLRFDFSDLGVPEVGLAVDTSRKGTGLGVSVVSLAVRHARQMNWPGLSAEVHEHNTVSAQVFERNDFRQVGQSGPFLLYQIGLTRGSSQ